MSLTDVTITTRDAQVAGPGWVCIEGEMAGFAHRRYVGPKGAGAWGGTQLEHEKDVVRRKVRAAAADDPTRRAVAIRGRVGE